MKIEEEFLTGPSFWCFRHWLLKYQFKVKKKKREMAMDLIPILYLTGIFSLILGIFHFFMPVLLDFRSAIPEDGPPLKPFCFWFYQYNTKRSDVYGIAWIMNHCVSLVLVTIGSLDLSVGYWLDTPFSSILFLWIAAWWFLRAGTQFYLGKRQGDWLVFGWLALLGLIHLGMVIL